MKIIDKENKQCIVDERDIDVRALMEAGWTVIRAKPGTLDDIEDVHNPKRSKKVDVPTEQWQKSIERRLEALEKMKTIPTSTVDKFMGEK